MRDERESAASRAAFVTHSLSLVGSSRSENCDCGISLGVRLCDHIVTSWTVDWTDVSTCSAFAVQSVRPPAYHAGGRGFTPPLPSLPWPCSPSTTAVRRRRRRGGRS